MSDSPRLWTGHTSAMDPGVLAAAHDLLVESFAEGEFSDHDWEHALGGVHAIVWDGDELVGHGSVVQRRVVHGDRALRCGYVEAVAVRATHRKRGHGATIMQALDPFIRGAYALGALGATDDAIELYRSLGWQVWLGESYALTPTGRVRTEDADGAIMVLPLATPLDLSGEITCDYRDGDLW